MSFYLPYDIFFKRPCVVTLAHNDIVSFLGQLEHIIRGVIFPDFSGFPDFLSCLRIFLVTICFPKT